MIPWVSTALAQPVPAELEAAEHAALEQIADCHARGPSCGADAHALGQAFATTALAGAVLRGTLDGRAVANAQLLDPGTVVAWRDLLPAPEGDADAWVLAFVPPPPSPPPLPVPEPATRRPALLRLSPGATELRLSAGHLRDDGWSATSGGLDARWSMGPVGVLATADGYHALVDPKPYTDLAPFEADGVSATLAVGPRWSGPLGAELFPFVGGRSWRGWANRHGTSLGDGSYRLGGIAGVAFLAPVARSGAVAVRGAAQVERDKLWSLDEPQLDYAMDTLVRLAPELSFAPVERLTVSVGPEIRLWPDSSSDVTWNGSVGFRR